MRTAVASLDTVPGAILRWGPDAVVSAHSPGGRPRAPGVAHAGRPLVIPSLSHVQAFLAFLGAHGHGRILIHCAAGLGRSPALAIIAMVSQGIDALSTCALVWEAVPHASLNRMRMTQAAPTEVRHEVGNWAVPAAPTHATAASTTRRSPRQSPPAASRPQSGSTDHRCYLDRYPVGDQHRPVVAPRERGCRRGLDAG